MTFCNPMDCSPPGSSIHRTLQARILKWVAMLFSRGSSRTRDLIQKNTRTSLIWCLCPFSTNSNVFLKNSCFLAIEGYFLTHFDFFSCFLSWKLLQSKESRLLFGGENIKDPNTGIISTHES